MEKQLRKSNQFTKVRIYIYIAYISLILLLVFLHHKEVIARSNIIVTLYFFLCFLIILGIGFIYPILVASVNVNKHLEFWLKKFSDAIDLFSLFVLLCAICQGVFSYGFFRASVVGESMVPSFENDDSLIVRSSNKNIKHFDIVVAVIDKDNRNYTAVPEDELLIKRAIGLPGDHIEFHGGKLYINGIEYYEPYIATHSDTQNKINLEISLGKGVELIDGEYVISEGYYFIMGDNRGKSSDSRTFGLFKEEQIIGVVKYRLHGIFNWEKIANPFEN